MKRAFVVLAVLIILIAMVATLLAQYDIPKKLTHNEMIYVGVTYCGDSVVDAKLLIDQVKSYTNLFVLQSGNLQRNLAIVDEIGDYAVSSGLYFIPYFGSYISPSLSSWLEAAKQRWGLRFLGVYYDDEPGGKMLDDYVEFKDAETGDTITKTRYGDLVVEKPNGVVIHFEIGGTIHLFEPALLSENSNFAPAEPAQVWATDIYATFYPNDTVVIKGSNSGSLGSNQDTYWYSLVTYQELLSQRPFKDFNEIADRFYLRNKENIQFMTNHNRVFTSDYALYWFDYRAGYDVVLAQIGWNNSFSQNIALIRGAANVQGKEWGIILTWKYDTAPYLDSGPELLSQMLDAYACGAKYIILFNYYEEGTDNPYGTLKEEHFIALKNFWGNIHDSSRIYESIQATDALFLPKNYGCGMRWEEDRLWGIMEPDANSHKIWATLQRALAEKGLHLDIIYDDLEYDITNKYRQVSYWNQGKLN